MLRVIHLKFVTSRMTKVQHQVLNAPMVDFQAKFVPKLSKGLVFTIHMPMATNVRPIKKGDVLCLPDLPNTL